MDCLFNAKEREKIGHIKRITMPFDLLFTPWPEIPLANKVQISLGISGLLLIVMHSCFAQT